MGIKKSHLSFAMFFLVFALLITTQVNAVQDTENDLTRLDIGLSWVHESQFAGMYLADQYGYYEEEGLDVHFHPYRYEDLAEELEKGNYDIVILQTDTLIEARLKQLPVKAIYVDYKIIPTTYFSKKSDNIKEPKDLIGKTVGVAYSERFPLITMLENVGVNPADVNITSREYNYEQLKSGEFDVEAGWITDGDFVEQAVGEYNKLSPYIYGVNWYADLVVVTEDTVDRNPKLIQSFINANAKGWEKVFESPNEAALLTKKYDSKADEEHLKFVLSESLPLMKGEDKLGIMDVEVFELTQEMLIGQGIIDARINVNNIFTNKFMENYYRVTQKNLQSINLSILLVTLIAAMISLGISIFSLKTIRNKKSKKYLKQMLIFPVLWIFYVVLDFSANHIFYNPKQVLFIYSFVQIATIALGLIIAVFYSIRIKKFMEKYNHVLLKLILFFIWTSVIIMALKPFFGISYLEFAQDIASFLVVFFGSFLIIDFLIKNVTYEKK